MTEANVIGNGLFDKNAINKSLSCVTCNFLNLNLDPIATCCYDYKAISRVDLNKINTKIVIKQIMPKINFPKPENVIFFKSSLGKNAGQIAAEYLIKLGYTKINLYGVTSRFLYDLSSESDKYYPKKIINLKPRIDRWNKTWDFLIANNPKVEFNFIK
jgi:hypothetical protein